MLIVEHSHYHYEEEEGKEKKTSQEPSRKGHHSKNGPDRKITSTPPSVAHLLLKIHWEFIQIKAK